MTGQDSMNQKRCGNDLSFSEDARQAWLGVDRRDADTLGFVPMHGLKPAESSSEMHEMLVTPAAFLAIDTPKNLFKN